MILWDFNPWKYYENYHEEMLDDKTSDLPQRPINVTCIFTDAEEVD